MNDVEFNKLEEAIIAAENKHLHEAVRLIRSLYETEYKRRLIERTGAKRHA